MYAEIASALASIKTATDLTALILKTKIDSAVTEKAVQLNLELLDLQSTIFAIQAQNHELLTENNQLKQELIDIQNWESEAAKYSLTEVARGVFVYTINEDQRGSQPTHWLCTNCYENRKKSILQKAQRTRSGYVFSCAGCKTNLDFWPLSYARGE